MKVDLPQPESAAMPTTTGDSAPIWTTGARMAEPAMDTPGVKPTVEAAMESMAMDKLCNRETNEAPSVSGRIERDVAGHSGRDEKAMADGRRARTAPFAGCHLTSKRKMQIDLLPWPEVHARSRRRFHIAAAVSVSLLLGKCSLYHWQHANPGRCCCRLALHRSYAQVSYYAEATSHKSALEQPLRPSPPAAVVPWFCARTRMLHES